MIGRDGGFVEHPAEIRGDNKVLRSGHEGVGVCFSSEPVVGRRIVTEKLLRWLRVADGKWGCLARVVFL